MWHKTRAAVSLNLSQTIVQEITEFLQKRMKCSVCVQCFFNPNPGGKGPCKLLSLSLFPSYTTRVSTPHLSMHPTTQRPLLRWSCQ